MQLARHIFFISVIISNINVSTFIQENTSSLVTLSIYEIFSTYSSYLQYQLVSKSRIFLLVHIMSHSIQEFLSVIFLTWSIRKTQYSNMKYNDYCSIVYFNREKITKMHYAYLKFGKGNVYIIIVFLKSEYAA